MWSRRLGFCTPPLTPLPLPSPLATPRCIPGLVLQREAAGAGVTQVLELSEAVPVPVTDHRSARPSARSTTSSGPARRATSSTEAAATTA